MEGYDIVLVDIENIKQFFNVFLFGSDYFARQCVPYDRDFLKDINEILELKLSFSLRKKHPAELRLLNLAAVDYRIKVPEIVAESQQPIIIAIQYVEYSRQEWLLPAQQPQTLSVVGITHFAKLTELLEVLGDDLHLLLGEVGFVVFAELLAWPD